MGSLQVSLVIISVVVALLSSGTHQAPQVPFGFPYPYYPAGLYYGGPAAAGAGYYHGPVDGRLGGGLFSALTSTVFTTTTTTFTYTSTSTCSRRAVGIQQCGGGALPFAANVFRRSLPESNEELIEPINPSQVSHSVEATQFPEAKAIDNGQHQMTGDYVMIHPGHYVALEPSMSLYESNNEQPLANVQMRQLWRRTTTVTFTASTTTVSVTTRVLVPACTVANEPAGLFAACPA